MLILSGVLRPQMRLSRPGLPLNLLILVLLALLLAHLGPRIAQATPVADVPGPEPYWLLIHVDGSGVGGVVVDPPGDRFDPGTTVTVTVEFESDCYFVGWSGDLDGSANPATLLMDRRREITATIDMDYRPVADAGLSQDARSRALVQLDGSGSSDPKNPTGPSPLVYHWTQRAGPAVLLDDPNSARPAFTAPAVWQGVESLTFALTVRNALGYSSPPALVTVAVTPRVGYLPLLLQTAV